MRTGRLGSWIVILSLGARVVLAGIPVPIAVAGTPKNAIQYSESAIQRAVFDADGAGGLQGKGATSVSVTVPYDAPAVGTVDANTILRFRLGEWKGRFWQSFTLGASNWHDGATSAKWDFDQNTSGVRRLTVSASWKRRLLKVKIRMVDFGDTANAFGPVNGPMTEPFTLGSGDGDIRWTFDAAMSFGGQDFLFDGTMKGSVSFKPGADNFERAFRFKMSGTGVLAQGPLDRNPPQAGASPFGFGSTIQNQLGGTQVDLGATDESRLATLAYSLDGGAPVPVQFTERLGSDGIGNTLHIAEANFFLQLSEGSHTFETIAVDEAGNSAGGPTRTSSFEYRMGPPQ